MDNGLLGEIRIFAGNFAPRGWAFCDGQLLRVDENTALFSILGTMYGGDGRTTFGLPDLRGRAPIHAGHGPGLTPHTLGQKGGEETAALTVNHLPNHTHNMLASSAPAISNGPDTTMALARSGFGNAYAPPHSLGDMSAGSIGNAGGTAAHNNAQPRLAVRYIIALVGEYPSRS